jgi:hypothetical protein
MATMYRSTHPFKRGFFWLSVTGLLGWAVIFAVPASSSAATTQTWSAGSAFGAHPTLNPAPDSYGDAGVWSWMSGTFNTPSTYVLGTHEKPTGCGSLYKKVTAWIDPDASNTLPQVMYNAGKTVPANDDNCEPGGAFKKGSLQMDPQYQGEGNPAAIIGWTSPIKGQVEVSGSLKGTQTEEGGITYEVDSSTSVLVGPLNEGSDVKATFGPIAISVKKGQSLYLEDMDGPGSNGAYDAVAVTFKISS